MMGINILVRSHADFTLVSIILSQADSGQSSDSPNDSDVATFRINESIAPYLVFTYVTSFSLSS